MPLIKCPEPACPNMVSDQAESCPKCGCRVRGRTLGVPNSASVSSSGQGPSDFTGSQAGDVKELAGRKFRWCPAGNFLMGTPGANDDESPVEVTLTQGFWMCETTVTQSQWQKLMLTTPWKGQTLLKEGANYPAICVNHDDAVDYAANLTQEERQAGRLPAGWKYALPTEAQWEYACRAGTRSKYSFGESEGQLIHYAWYDANLNNERYAHEVGKKRANPWGLLDMHGNVWEWCSDWYDNKLIGGEDPVGPNSGSDRVGRGGGWGYAAVDCRSAYRSRITPDYRNDFLGFRVSLQSVP